MSRKEAALLSLAIDWDDYPNLRVIFELRPPQNVYWTELISLVREVSAKGLLEESDE